MKHSIKLIGTISLALIIGIFTAGCVTSKNAAGGSNTLAVPSNVQITLDTRLMTVTWNTVPYAQGYLVITTSEGCGSGNRTINTKDGTAVATSSGNNAIFDDARNGAVQIRGENKIEITLMPEWNIPGDNTSGRNESVPMASSVTAKVMAIGGIAGNGEYIDSAYSEETAYVIKK